ncbi:MAG: NAD(P)-binding protein [Bacteroidia bacterium]
MAPEWDFIIVGGGASGLSLAYTLSISELAFNRVLIFEP